MTTTFWTLERVHRALGAGPRGDTPLRAVSTDTRTVQDGDLFVALVGDTFDGHDFLRAAAERGARAVVVSSAERARGIGVPVYEVGDTLVALGRLASFRRRAWNRPVVGVAGSNGKTTTKDLLSAALGGALEVHATAGNLNNLVGVPLTLLALSDDADIAVVELGVNVPGEMTRLRAIAEPTIAVITSIGEEHLEGLGDMAGVLREESIALEGAVVAIVPAGLPGLERGAAQRARRVIVAGLDSGDCRAEAWGMEPTGCGWITIDGVTVRPPLRGEHNLRNTMLALAVARECGVAAETAARGIESMAVPSMRLAWETVGLATLINDAYNANPASMRAAIDLLDRLDGRRQKVVVLGAMRELGAHAGALHDEIARRALASSAVVIGGVGEMGDALLAAGGGDARVITASDPESLWPRLEPRLEPDAIILLKASRGVKLERLVPSLTAWANR